MGSRVYATVGRAADCDVVLEHPTVSNHHARLSWAGAAILVEDLSSGNGTFVDGKRVTRAKVRAGAEVRMGAAVLPWSHSGLRPLLRAGAGQRTLAMPQVTLRSYVCGACGHLGALPAGATPKRLACESCKAVLRTSAGGGGGLAVVLGVIVLVVAGAAVGYRMLRGGAANVAPTLSPTAVLDHRPTVEPQRHVGQATAEKLAAALTPMDPVTRNAAAQLAARSQGPFHVEQVAEIWSAVRQKWRYVNDPRGREYFATASETITNGYVGDCDDFAIVLASMVTAIGGESRVVLMDGPNGGHAYTEACVQGDAPEVSRALQRLYRTRWKRYLRAGAPRTMSYRSSQQCPVWLNLDWNSQVPGGEYEAEHWAVAVYEEGRSELLAPAPGPTAEKPRTAERTGTPTKSATPSPTAGPQGQR